MKSLHASRVAHTAVELAHRHQCPQRAGARVAASFGGGEA